MIRVLDMTSLFTKELLMYSMFDIQFARPVRLKYVAYLILWLIIWTTPILMLTWVPGPYGWIIAVAPPFGMAHLMSQPVWGGKSFVQWFTTQINFISSPKTFLDGKVSNEIGSYRIDNKYTVSRRSDFVKLLREDR